MQALCCLSHSVMELLLRAPTVERRRRTEGGTSLFSESFFVQCVDRAGISASAQAGRVRGREESEKEDEQQCS